MDWIERLNEAIDYIEENLTGKIEYEKLGQIACCSSYHFQRMFTYIAGMPLSKYIRKRKMSLAAVDFNQITKDLCEFFDITICLFLSPECTVISEELFSVTIYWYSPNG